MHYSKNSEGPQDSDEDIFDDGDLALREESIAEILSGLDDLLDYEAAPVVSAPEIRSDDLDADDEAVVAALEDAAERSEAKPVILRRPPERFMLTVDEMESAARIQAGKDRIAKRETERLKQTRRQSADRSRRYRAREREPVPTPSCHRRTQWAQRRLNTLLKATANTGDKILQQLRGREELHVEYLEWFRMLQTAHKKTSDAAIAESMGRPEITKQTVRNIRANIASLERLGRPWHGLA